MADRTEFLTLIRNELINSSARGFWIDNLQVSSGTPKCTL
jgi:hypothetical protein